MQQHTKVTIDDIDDDDDDDDDDVKQEVTQTIEKFVQTRHVQTLKYLRHVIDENRHLRLHIEHLKRRQDDPVPSPANVDPIESEETPISEIPLGTPELIIDPDHIDEATNTDGEDFEAKYNELCDEIVNLKKQYNINREEFQRELERVDQDNTRLEKDLKTAQKQLILVQKNVNDKELEIQKLNTSISDQKLLNNAANFRITKLEQNNRQLTQSLETSEEKRLDVESKLEGLRQLYQQTEKSLSDLQIEYQASQAYLQSAESDIESFKEKLHVESGRNERLCADNEELKETIKYLREQLQEKIIQEEQSNREKQANSNFKDFVQVRRTLQMCQQENEQLKAELKKLQIKFLNKKE